MKATFRRVLTSGATLTAAAALIVVPAVDANAAISYGKRAIFKFGRHGKLDIDDRGRAGCTPVAVSMSLPTGTPNAG